ncbi:bifunctional molybdenum cofactor biosynthesis protein MoaC/MoaB [Putridiphycobacter roseus]|uniref:Molybdopterin adenylyltransferase n=1 Tax=Putridiphycobacter roseus TaxID=2219161 RepID=A0A2W1N0N9_9FLAO|nr:bifunctional molybdenum cofactor biosynthesis protein MoaC/MoaB [Putridiphycobacter roseus]PZE17100.1 bifunctional molybdenum cofactor biosynthesis protein MoaC/MoaB [Putridiphycobacter roseus]
MVDITHKSNTLRIAVAQAIVHVSTLATITAIENNTVPKGNVFEMAKAAGFLGVKQTPHLLPDCHPIPIESTKITYFVEGLSIRIEMEVKTIYKTGVEVEAMHGASVVALTMYDMLKPIDKGIEIGGIKLLSKSGGKSDFKSKLEKTAKTLSAHVVVCSDTISKGLKSDGAGKSIVEVLKHHAIHTREYYVIPDEKIAIELAVEKAKLDQASMLIFTGGTGLSLRDVTPETLLPMLDRRIPGIEETIRQYGQERTPYAMLSRSVVGTIDNTLVMALPGSTNGAKESITAVMPHLIHVFDIFKGKSH